MLTKIQVRCSSDRPACKRCTRLRHDCVYPSEGFQTRAVSQSNRASHELGSVPAASRASVPQRLDGHEYLSPEATAPLIWSSPRLQQPSENTVLGIPDSLVTTLVDVYYSHVYNASLLVHRPTFLQALKAGNANPAVVLSICAFASMYGA